MSGSEICFVSNEQKELFILDMDDMTYISKSTVAGLFDGALDRLQRPLLEENSCELSYCIFAKKAERMLVSMGETKVAGSYDTGESRLFQQNDFLA